MHYIGGNLTERGAACAHLLHERIRSFGAIFQKRRVAFVALMLLLVCSPGRATDFYWDADGATPGTVGGNGTWDTSNNALWRQGGTSGPLVLWPNAGLNDDALLQGTFGTLTLGAAITVNDITVAPSPSGTYAIAGTQALMLGGTTKSVLDIATGSTLTITSGITGTAGFSKNSGGTLILDTAQANAPSTLFGDITINAGTLQAGSTASNSASQVLRSNAVNLVGGSLTTVGTVADLRIGQLSGSGSVTPATGGALNILALSDATFSGSITTTGGLNLRGGNATSQTLSGNVTALSGSIGINSGATLTLSGTGTNGVLGSSASLISRGGTLVLDNSGGNATNGRFGDGASIAVGNGGFSLIGNSAGSSETVGAFTMNSGSSTISVTNNGTGAVLAFTDSGSLRDSTSGVLNFVGLGTGTLGSAGNAPRITFSGAVNVTTANGALTSGNGTSITYGWARVNGTNWAGIGANGVTALAETARDSTTLASAAASEVTTFSPSSTITTLTADLGAPATPLLLKITPSGAGQSLASGGFNINATGLILAGNTDFSITGGGALFGTVNATRYIYVTDSNTVLNVSQSFFGSSNQSAFNKAGPGTLFLNGSASQLPATGTAQNVNILEGVLRGSLATLGGGLSSGGAFTNINLYGGVLEISGGGTLTRALVTSAASGLGGVLKWDNNSASARGDGGFSAIGGDAAVTLVTTVGGATAATPNWNDQGFIQNGYALTMGSTKADSRIDFTNSFGLDNGGATSTYFAREFRVADNPGVTTDIARFSGVISGSVNADLLKTGAGALELTNANIFAGNTLIQQGRLEVNNTSGSGTGSGQVIVRTGATLRGKGIVTGNITVQNGGVIGAGTGSTSAGTTGVFTTNAQTWSNGTIFEWRVTDVDQTTPGTGWDQLSVSQLTLPTSGTPITVKLVYIGNGAPTHDVNTPFTIPIVISRNTATPLVNASMFTLSFVGSPPPNTDAADYSITQLGDGSIAISYVPEPASSALAGIFAGCTLLRRRRRSAILLHS